MKKIIPIFLIIIIISCNSEIKHPPGMLAKDPPLQTELAESKIWIKDDYIFTAHANFELKAKVLGKERYRYDSSSEISPYDLALGWGQMSDQRIVDEIDISQSSRWFTWYLDSYLISRRELELSAANMHMIPANEEIEDELDEIIVGEIIYLKGYLVAVKRSDGWRWKSSLTRKDTGGGACEVVWVEKLLRLK
jgi:hypothetical protein